MLDQDNKFFLISLSILITWWLDNLQISKGEITCLTLLGVEGLIYSCYQQGKQIPWQPNFIQQIIK